jgi:enamine deaminase RidA (YjgF/YER057c/UK114 family)
MKRENFSTGTPWEPRVGYSRVVRIGPFVYVSGTTATDEHNEIVGGTDPYEQAKQALRNVETALKMAGASLESVVRTRLFVRDIEHWAAIGHAHSEYFGNVRPATTMVEVSALVRPEMLVEIEAEAVVGEIGGSS